MGHAEAGADLISVRPQLQAGGDDHEAGGVVGVAVDGLRQDLQSVDVGGTLAANGRLGAVAALGHHVGAARRVRLGHSVPVRMLVQILLALEQPLLVRVHRLDVLQLHPRQRHQAVLDGHGGLAHHKAVVLGHQVVNLPDCTGGAVLDGHHAVIGTTLFQG